MTRVAVLGAAGRMGITICQGLIGRAELVAVIDPIAQGRRLRELAGEGVADLVIGDDLSQLKSSAAEVAIDFTVASSAMANLAWCAANGVHVVCGTTGLDSDARAEIAQWFSPASGTNCILAANFAISAVLAMRLAEIAAPYFDGVEVIELHHNQKQDAPSGTAIETAQRLARARASSATPFAADPTTRLVHDGARGAEVAPGVRVHAIRLPGLVAHEEIVFGAPGQTLSIRQDSYDRTSFLPGVLLAVDQVASRPGFTYGLDQLLA